jgi:isopentenyl-diphosphate delta-isomerase
MNPDREQELVELVAPDGAVIGVSTVADAHVEPGLLHRAFSVLLFDPAGRTLLQRRAATKSRFPLRWANSCCGHPTPGESLCDAAGRRLWDELGIRGVELREVGVYTYAALDPATGRAEREYDHVLVGEVDGDLALAPDPDEIDVTRWADGEPLLQEITVRSPNGYAPWLAGVLGVALGSPSGSAGPEPTV